MTFSFRSVRTLPLLSCLTLALCLTACGIGWNGSQDRRSTEDEQRQRDEKTREDVAKATERMKPALQDAGKQLGHAAAVAAEEARAAAEGVKDGWTRGQKRVVDINSASESELADLPGVSRREAQRIIARRPYHDRHELVTKGVLSESGYDRIRDYISLR